MLQMILKGATKGFAQVASAPGPLICRCRTVIKGTMVSEAVVSRRRSNHVCSNVCGGERLFVRGWGFAVFLYAVLRHYPRGCVCP